MLSNKAGRLVEAPADGSLQLLAETAEWHGKQFLQSQGFPTLNIGHWVVAQIHPLRSPAGQGWLGSFGSRLSAWWIFSTTQSW